MKGNKTDNRSTLDGVKEDKDKNRLSTLWNDFQTWEHFTRLRENIIYTLPKTEQSFWK